MVMRKGFTMIELLVVISIIMVLAGLVMASMGPIRRQAAKTRTSGILAIVANAIASAGTANAQNLGTAEHPLASSAATRYTWVRASDGVTQVTMTGDALRASNPAYVTAGADRLLKDDDLFADPIAPQFVGIPRWRMSVLGATTKWVSSWKRITSSGSAGTLVEPDLAVWQNEGFMRTAITDPTSEEWDKACIRAINVALGTSQEELAALGAIARTDAARDPLILDNRLRHDKSQQAKPPDSNWFPGTVQIGGVWTPYRIRGGSIIDSWGREILVSMTPSGALRLESAGADGVFRWNPGSDGVLQTAAGASSPAGDDRDGAADNIVLGPEG